VTLSVPTVTERSMLVYNNLYGYVPIIVHFPGQEMQATGETCLLFRTKLEDEVRSSCGSYMYVKVACGSL
jgi:hypothetical protein